METLSLEEGKRSLIPEQAQVAVQEAAEADLILVDLMVEMEVVVMDCLLEEKVKDLQLRLSGVLCMPAEAAEADLVVQEEQVEEDMVDMVLTILHLRTVVQILEAEAAVMLQEQEMVDPVDPVL